MGLDGDRGEMVGYHQSNINKNRTHTPPHTCAHMAGRPGLAMQRENNGIKKREDAISFSHSGSIGVSSEI